MKKYRRDSSRLPNHNKSHKKTMDKFKNKYRIPSARLAAWDYGRDAAYFITINTADKKHYFGKIANSKMQYSEMGQLAEKYWLEIPQHFPYIELGNWVIMPNHTHGILIINKSTDDSKSENDSKSHPVQTRLIASPPITKQTRLIASLPITKQTRLIASLPITNKKTTDSKKTGGITSNKNTMINDNISRAIRWYKGRCTFEIRKIQANFKWQHRFHDHIIRNNTSFNNIQNYITNNPSNWDKDKFNR